MATTIWSNKQIHHWGSGGYIKIDASYDYYRSGADMYYTVSVTVKQTGSGSYFNDKVGCQIKLDGAEVYYNSTLKGTTSSSTKTWSRTANVNNARVANKTTGTTTLSVRVWDSQGSASFDSTNTANLTVSAAMPILTVGAPSAAINYANFTITDSTGQTMTNYEIANSSGTTVQSGTLNSSSATIKFSGISGTRLSQGTKYSGYKIRAKNSIGWGNYATIPDFTTVSLPNASTSGDFNIGNNTKITISSANYISAWSVSASDGSSTKTGTGSGTECTVAVGDSSYVNSMLTNHPNDFSWTMTYVVHLYSDGVYAGSRTVYNTCSIPSNSYNPTFTSDKVTYEDVNSAITSITGNNQKIIKGYSNVRFTIKPMTPGTGASASKYKVTANGTSQEAAHTGNNLQFTFNSVSSKSYSVQATDSRNKSTTVTGDYSTFIEYVIPSFATNNTKRTDQGIGSNVNINATFSYYNWSGLATTNTITEVKYKVGSGNWITIPTSDYTVANGTLSINHTTTGESFSQDTIYTITISVKDRLATREASIMIPSSQPLLWKDRLNKWLGIKKKPTCELDVDGNINANNYLGQWADINTGFTKGIPAGGTAGQLLTKKTDTDYDTEWFDITGSFSNSTIGTIVASSASGTKDLGSFTSWSWKTVPLTRVMKQVNSSFALDGNFLVNKSNKTINVLVSANGMFYSDLGSSITYDVGIFNNTTMIADAYLSCNPQSWNSIQLSPFLLSVNPGDKISLTVRFGDKTTAKVNGEATFITIQELEVPVFFGNDSAIVESGSNANGTYVKYSDGRMECYKRVTQKNVKLTGTWYGLYINENDTTVDLGNYAATFIEEPIVNITYMGGNGCWLINNNYHSASSPGKVQLCTVSSRTIGTCILDVTAKGKWK